MDELVGRENELAVVRRLVDVVRRGTAASMLVEGEAGIGKTEVVRRLADEARDVGASVLWGGSHPFERRPFGVLADALDLRPRSADPQRARIARLLVGGDGPDESTAPPADATPVIVDGIVDLLERSCAGGATVLVLEDLHWADDSTLGAVRSILRDLRYVPLLLVATLRPFPRAPQLDMLFDDFASAGTQVLKLRSLEQVDVEALVHRKLGARPGPMLSSIIEKAAGNPLWIVELASSLSAEGWLRRDGDVVEATADELPDTLRELVLRRLRYLPARTLALLERASLLGEAVPIRDLAIVARQEATEVAAALSEAFRGRLLDERGDTVVFRHQLVQQAIYEDIPMPARRALHRDAADAFARTGGDLMTVASHVLLGADPGDLEAVGWLREAAAVAGATAPLSAVDLLGHAVELVPAEHPEADMINAELAEAMYRSGQVAGAAALAESVLARQHRDDADLPLRLTQISALSLMNQPVTLINRAEATLQVPGLSAEGQALVLAQESFGRMFSGDFVGGEVTARRALSLAEGASSVEMTVWSLGALSLAVKTQGRYGEALESARRAVALAFDPLDDAARRRFPHFFLGMALADADRFGEAAQAYGRSMEEAEQLGAAWLLPDMLALSGELRFLVGDWDDAEAELESGLLLAGEHGQRISINQSRAYQAVVAAASGDLRGARAALDTVAAQLSEDAPYYAVQLVAYAAAVIAEAENDPAGALDILQQFWERDLKLGIRYYQRWFGPPLVRLAVAAGQADFASEVVATVEAGAVLAADIPSVQAAALRCRGLLEGDPGRLLDAVEPARRSGRALDHAAACEDAAAILGPIRADDAKELLLQAQSTYDDMGAHAWSARVAAALRRMGVRQGARGRRRRGQTGQESLTKSEGAVTELVAQGLTNREVARRLHISPHTVNTHLRHVFQKLGVTTRAELAAMIAGRPDREDITHLSDVSGGGGRGS